MVTTPIFGIIDHGEPQNSYKPSLPLLTELECFFAIDRLAMSGGSGSVGEQPATVEMNFDEDYTRRKAENYARRKTKIDRMVEEEAQTPEFQERLANVRASWKRKPSKNGEGKAKATATEEPPPQQQQQTATPESDDLLQSFNPRKQPVKKENLKSEDRPSDSDRITAPEVPAQARASLSRGPISAVPRPGSSVRTNSASNHAEPSNGRSFAQPSDNASRPNTNTNSTKRRAEPASANDHRAPKIPKRPSASAASSSAAAVPEHVHRSGADRTPPTWYTTMKTQGGRGRGSLVTSDADVQFSRLKASIKKRVEGSGPSFINEEDVLNRLHTLAFLAVDDVLLHKQRVLHNKDGLPRLFDAAFSDSVDWPWYIKADAQELYNKWCARQFESDLFRGIKIGIKKARNGTDDSSKSDSLMPGSEQYRLMNPKQHGNGLLVNGSWWPSQMAALRDGAHGSTQSGITGTKGASAYSVIMSGGNDPSGQPYPNEDQGDTVLYCGTDSSKANGDPSDETQMLIVNMTSRQPVRLIRSHNCPSTCRPEAGFRYDGLYNVVEFEVLPEPPNKTIKRHRFRLSRCPGQDPIRADGPEKRPTQQEVEAYNKDRMNRGR